MLFSCFSERGRIERRHLREGEVKIVRRSNRFLFLIGLFVIAAVASTVADASAASRIRGSVLAGSWYEKSKAGLAKQVDQCLERATVGVAGPYRIRALVSPHAGYEWSGPTAAYAYKALQGSRYKRVVLLGPSHRLPLQGGAITDVDAYETPLGTVPLDLDSCKALLASCSAIAKLPPEKDQEHSLEIQLPFLQRTLGEFSLVPIMIGEITPNECEQIANAIRPLLDNNTLLVLSSDFTHQGPRFDYIPFKKNVQENIRRLDFTAVNAILNLDVREFWGFCEAVKSTICGKNPIKIGLLALPMQTQVDFAHYETSGDRLKDYSETVSYCALVFRERPDYLDEKETALLLESARKTLEKYFAEGKPKEVLPPADQRMERLQEKKGVFVTLKEKGQLRGCIGHLTGTDTLDRTVASTVLLSAFQDTRFNPLQKDELPKVDIEISVMSPMKEIASWKDIVLGRDGVVLEKNGRSALFLPQVALEQGWNVEETLSQLSKKAGLNPDDWKSGCRFKTFTAQVFGEKYKNLKPEAP